MFFKFKRKKRIKKRIYLSVFFTAGLVALTNNIWLVEVERHKYSFQPDIFFIVLVLSFLLMYKLSEYLARFKSINRKSKIDIAFLLLFFIFSFVPMSHIDNKIKARHENRFLEVYKPLINPNGSLNYDFGKDFEKFFNDRFFLRSFLISNYHFIRAIFAYKYYETQKAIYIKNNNYVLSKTHVPLEEYFNRGLALKTANSLNRFQDFCNKYHIKLYVIVVPYNQHIYQDEIKPFDNPQGMKALNDNIDLFISKTKATVIYPFDELKEASKKDRTYFKTDHHWTDWGAYIGYRALMAQINKDYPKIHPVSEDDYTFTYSKKIRKDFKRRFVVGNQLSRAGSFLMPLKKKILDYDYRYFEFKDKDSLAEKRIDDETEKSKKSYYPKAPDYKVMEFGNSMGYNLMPFIQPTFRNVKAYFVNEVIQRNDEEDYKLMKYYKKDIIDFKPDIIILCITNQLLDKINDFFEEEN